MDENYLAADRGQTSKDPVNPFVHHLELTTTYEKIKVGVLFICRSMTFLVCVHCYRRYSMNVNSYYLNDNHYYIIPEVQDGV